MFHHPLDALTRDLTAFDSFKALLDSHESYRPTLTPRDTQHIDLADGFDAAMADRGSSRRAWRGIGDHELRSTYAPASPEGFRSVRLAGVPAGSGLASEWLRVIWTINAAAKAEGIEQLIGGSLDTSHGNPDGSYVEEYPEFRVVLRHTAWGNGENSGTISALTADADRRLSAAVEQVRGRDEVAETRRFRDARPLPSGSSPRL